MELIHEALAKFKYFGIPKGMELSFQESRNWLFGCPFSCALGRGESAMLDAQERGCDHYPGSPLPASVWKVVLASALAKLIPEKRLPYPWELLEVVASHVNTSRRYQSPLPPCSTGPL
jgi:hypothetical protein